MDDKDFKGNNRTIEFNKKLITINSNKKYENELKSDYTIDFKNQANTTSIDILQNKSKLIIINLFNTYFLLLFKNYLYKKSLKL